jgi:hypothetical protein
MPSQVLPLSAEQLRTLTEAAPAVFQGRQETDNYNIVTVDRVRHPSWVTRRPSGLCR